jgi:leucyl aminopeptidase
MITCSGHYGLPKRVTADAYVLFLFADRSMNDHTIQRIAPDIGDLLETLRKTGQFSGKRDEVMHLLAAQGQFLLVGLGDRMSLSVEQLRRAAAQAVGAAGKVKTLGLYCLLEEQLAMSPVLSFDDMVEALLEGSLLRSYAYTEFVSGKGKEKLPKTEEIKVITADEGYQTRMKKAVTRSRIIAEAVEYTRNLVNSPPNALYPQRFAKLASDLGKQLSIKTTVLDQNKISSLKMAGLLAVNKGSTQQPFFIIMEYNEKRKTKPWVLVGKGITFDSGGLSIKPASAMEDMKTDMGGAAAVLGVMMAAARLKLPQRIIGLIPVTDNMVGSEAMCPGDVLTMANGTTVEVLNTDAEGRLILADALIYAQRYAPAGIIDLATLTGACVVALASHATGMMGTDDETMHALAEAGERTYERVWQLPLFEEYSSMLESDVADIKNIAGRWGGAITAAAFLKHFVGTTPWVHLDIAGTASLERANHYQPKGGTGVGVRLLVEFFSKQMSK